MNTGKFVLFDVGASMGIHPRWKLLKERFHCFGFEPNEEEYAKLRPDPQITWINAALADKNGSIDLHLTKAFQNSSTRHPNREVLAELAWGDGHKVVRTLEVPCKTLDTVAKESDARPDFLKLDTQGTELDILQATSAELINGLVGIELEVSFLQVYEGQALFSETDAFLRRHGLLCWDFGNVLRMKPRGLDGYQSPYGRLISCDALYFRRPNPAMSPEQIARLCVALSLYGYEDEAEFIRRQFQIPGDIIASWRVVPKGPLSSLIPWPLAYRLLSKSARLFLPRQSSIWETGLGGWR
jgi:FkbM family methyltransferase